MPTPRVHLIVLLLATFLMQVAGLQRTLPLLLDVDEPIFVEAAIRIASSGNLDPGFYGNPGSTLIYPLAAGFRLWHAWTQSGQLLRADALLFEHFLAARWEYYFAARLLSVAFAVGSVALVTLLGRRAWASWPVGLAAGWLTAANLTIVYHTRMVRTDGAGLFFGLLAAWLALRILERPTLLRYVLAGAAVGLAASSRYFVGVVGVMMIGAAFLTRRRSPRTWLWLLCGGAAGAAAFFLTNPAMVTNLGEVIADVRNEARATHLGADGLTPLGNLLWYLGEGIPTTTGWLWAVAAAGIVTTALQQRRGHDRRGAWLLLLYLVAFVGLISLLALHWHRWLIPVLPVIFLFAAAAMVAAVDALAGRLQWSDRRTEFLLGGVLVTFLAMPLVRVVHMDIRDAGDNTRILAREWIVANLPEQSSFLQEAYGALLDGTEYPSQNVSTLPSWMQEEGLPLANLEPLRNRGYDYVLVSSFMVDRYLAEPERYPDEVAFYNRLEAEGRLVQEFAPSWRESGPTLRIYAP
jgi:4-amino-4-deoxy-L-arabinose transferase-like glycosyltransferase